MKDFLQRLAERALGTAPLVRPLIPSFHTPIFLAHQDATAHPAELQQEGPRRRAATARRGDRDRPEKTANGTAEAPANHPTVGSPPMHRAAQGRKERQLGSEVASPQQPPEHVLSPSETRTDSAFTTRAPHERVRRGAPDAEPLSVLAGVQIHTPAHQGASSDHSSQPSKGPHEISLAMEGSRYVPVLRTPSIASPGQRDNHADKSSPNPDLPRSEREESYAEVLRAPVSVRLCALPRKESEDIAGARARPETKRDEPERVVHITIGRIEVCATPPALPVRRALQRAAPKLSLDDYLKRVERRHE